MLKNLQNITYSFKFFYLQQWMETSVGQKNCMENNNSRRIKRNKRGGQARDFIYV